MYLILYYTITICSPVIVADDANIEVACRRIMWGKCINAGQSCVAPDYVLCSPLIKDQLIGGLRRAVEQFFGEVNFKMHNSMHMIQCMVCCTCLA